MHTGQTNKASRYLLALAGRISQVYASHPNTRAIIVTGSAVEGVSDYYSDLDMIVYYEALPAEKELLAACQQNQGQKRNLLGEPGAEETAESYLVNGIECQVGHTTIGAWERDIATVLERLEVASPIQKALAGLLDALPLYGEPLVQQWRARIAAYPDTLAQAMVTHYLAFFPLWGIQERIAGRDATIWLYQILVETAHHLLGVLSGLNRCYYSSFQFKRMQRFIAQLEIAPTNFSSRLEAIFHTDAASAAVQVQELVRETVTLVEQHMPQIDTTHVRQGLDWRQQAWRPGQGC
jgi:hypothetical protein